ncbi:MAG: iron ABC transporter permease [Candidatus Methanomethylophilaceae archaeon]|nr:iron ABC transporter permease [Candidatus Methanomethylophilaceae archaeon]
MRLVEYSEIRFKYGLQVHKKVLFTVLCLALAVVGVGVTLSVGKFDIGFLESYIIIWNHLMGVEPTTLMGETKDFIVWDLRLPRAIMALFVGAALAVGGVVMQGVMRNPLADPYTLGVSSAASLGATLCIVLGFSLVPGLTKSAGTMVNAFIFSMIPIVAITLITRFKKTTPTMMILSGIAIMYVFSATTQLIMLYADPDNLADAYSWSVGTLGKSSWENLPVVIAVTVVGMALVSMMGKQLNILSAGDKISTTLGVDTGRCRVLLMLLVSITTATVVSFTGTIGFVGLVAPHVVRFFIGSDNRYVIPASACLGALLLVLADCVAKEAGATGLPVGVITALIGGPLFIALLIRQRRKVWN